MFMLDTNACIDFLDGRSSLLEARVDKHFGHLTISVISVAELMVGSKTSSNPRRDAERLDAFIAGVDLAEFNLATARRYGEVIKQIGVRRKSYDRLIGVQALALGLTLVTRNGKDFADVPGLVVENWTE